MPNVQIVTRNSTGPGVHHLDNVYITGVVSSAVEIAYSSAGVARCVFHVQEDADVPTHHKVLVTAIGTLAEHTAMSIQETDRVIIAGLLSYMVDTDDMQLTANDIAISFRSGYIETSAV